MANIKELLNNARYQHVRELLTIAGELSHRTGVAAYAVGGCVRDLLLGKNLYDLDLMIEGEGIPFARKLAAKLGVKKVVPFEKFGTALIPSKPIQIEVATSRMEVYDADSRKPSEINYTDLHGDLSRRDFSINAMAMDIHPENFGELTDPFGGISDLNSGILRTPMDPDETFSDDPLRIMRAAYFTSKLRFRIKNNCLDSMKRQAERIIIVSWERKRDEFIKILSTDKPSIGLLILKKSGLMNHIFPEIDVMDGLEQTSEWHHKDIFLHTLQVVDNVAELSDKMELRFAALVHDIAKPNTRKIDSEKGYTFHGHDAVGKRMLNKVAKRMKLPNKLAEYLKKLTLLHLRPIALVKEEVTDSAVRRLMVDAGEELDDLMTLCRADITTKNPTRVKRYMRNFEIVEEKMGVVVDRDAMKTFQSPVGGDEIMEICGLEPGKKIGEIKSAIEEAILDGKIENSYDAAKRYLMEIKDRYLSG